MKRQNIFAALAFILSACAPKQSPEQMAFLKRLAHRPVTCEEGDDCRVKWSRAIAWVARHSQRGIREVSGDLIATNMVTSGDKPPLKYPEFTVVRYALKNGYAFNFDSYCEHGYACSNPSALQLRAGFVTYVMGPPAGVTLHPDGEGAFETIR